MELSTLLMIYLAVAFLISVIGTIACVVQNELYADQLVGIIILSLTWPVSIIPFLTGLIINNINNKDNK